MTTHHQFIVIVNLLMASLLLSACGQMEFSIEGTPTPSSQPTNVTEPDVMGNLTADTATALRLTVPVSTFTPTPPQSTEATAVATLLATQMPPTTAPSPGTSGFAASVVYTTDETGSLLYTLGEGDTPILIADHSMEGTVSNPLISDDGAWIAYAVNRTDGSSQLWAVDVSTLTGNSGLNLPRRLLVGADQISSGQPEIVDSPQSYEWQAGTHTLYFNTRYTPESGITSPGEYTHNDLWKVNADTGEVVNILSRDSAGQFYLSPDGQYVGVSNRQFIALVRADGVDFKRVLDFPAPSTWIASASKPVLVWSPDSTFFSMLVMSPDPLAADATGDVYRVSLSGEAQHLVRLSGNYLHSVPPGAGISPDGQYLAYRPTPSEGDNLIHLRVIHTDGTGDMPVADDPSLSPLGWSPDSKHFVFMTASNGSYIAGLEGAPQLFGEGIQADFLQWVDATSFYFLGTTNAGEWGLYFYRLGETTQMVVRGVSLSASFDIRP